jgi:SAM-dependent methyltransferase
MSAHLTVRQTCRLCGSPRIVCSVALAQVPIVSPNVGTAGDDGGEPISRLVAPLDNYLCQDCGLNQLVHVVDPSLIYRRYLYRTSVSLGLAAHFATLSQTVMSRAALRPGDLVVEFGSNDGTLLRCFRDAGLRVQGIDPAREIAAEATTSGIPTRADFFGPAIAREIATNLGPARAVLSNNAMANIDDLAAILTGVKTIMAPDGVFVFETQYALDVFEKTLLDVIYHEHISTFSVQPVARALAGYGLSVFDAERIATKGGSIRFWIQHAGGPQPTAPRVQELVALEQRTGLYDLGYHQQFADRVARIRNDLHAVIDEVRRSGGRIGGYGTSVGCAALIHQFALEDKLDVLFDDAPFKPRLAGPGYDLPVETADGVLRHKPALIVLLAWRYAEPILRKHAPYLAQGGRFVVPLPQVLVLR